MRLVLGLAVFLMPLISALAANDPCDGIKSVETFDCRIPNTADAFWYSLIGGRDGDGQEKWCLSKRGGFAGIHVNIQVPTPTQYGDTLVLTDVTKSGLIHLYSHKDTSLIEINLAPTAPLHKLLNTGGPETEYVCRWNPI